MEILKKTVKRHNDKSCRILMHNKYKEQEMLVMTQETFEKLVGRKFEKMENEIINEDLSKPIIKLSYLLKMCKDKSVNQYKPKIYFDIDCEVLY